MISGCLRIATDLGVDPMRALQMATIDPATFLGLDEELGGVAPGPRGHAQRAARGGEWRPELVLVEGEIVARDGALTAATPRPALAGRAEARRPGPEVVPLTGVQPVARYESAVINRRVDREVRAERPPGRAGRPRRDVDRRGWSRACSARTASPPPRPRGSSCWCSARDPDAMVRAARRVADMGGGFAFDGGWSAPLEIDGLITAGDYAHAVAIERELTDEMRRAGLSVPRSAVLPVVRLRRIPAGGAVTPRGVLEVKTRTVLEGPSRIDTVPGP